MSEKIAYRASIVTPDFTLQMNGQEFSVESAFIRVQQTAADVNGEIREFVGPIILVETITRVEVK